jgi:branched-chain amino acid transport system substrate-binding protein
MQCYLFKEQPMKKSPSSSGITRRQLLAQSAAGAAVATGITGFPAILKAQSNSVKIGFIHPASGGLAYPGAQSRLGGQMAIEDINAAGGIKSLGAKLEAVLGDSQGKPEIGASEVEKMASAGVHAFTGCYQSAVGLAASQAAAKYNLPFSIDVGVSDTLVNRGLKNVFRMADGYGRITSDAVDNLNQINQGAGSPAKSAVIVHEESEFGTGTARLLSGKLKESGWEVKDVIKHANPTRNFDNIALRIRSMTPDVVIPVNYPGEYILLAQTLKQQRVPFMASYSVLGGGFNFKFLDEKPEIAEHMIDFNHWYDPTSAKAKEMRKRVEATGNYFTFEVYCTYNSIRLLADGFERAGSKDPDAVNAALASSTLDPLIMPYGPTKMVNGQNMGARAVAIQAQMSGGKLDAQVIYPTAFASAQPIFPRPA